MKAQPLSLETCQIENTSFLPGEEITYEVYYNLNFVWFKAAKVVFTVSDLGDEFHIMAKGKTYKSYDWLFKVDDTFESYISKESLYPRKAVRDIKEGKYRLYDRVEFDQENYKATVLRGKSRAELGEELVFDLNGCMHDILSLMYYVRNLPVQKMKKGDTFGVQLFLDKEVYPLRVSYKGLEESKKVKKLGKYNAHLFMPETIEGSVFKKGDKMKIWVSDDNNRIPLLIDSPINVGSVKVVLKDYKNLRYGPVLSVDK